MIAQIEHGFLAARKAGQETADPGVWACGLQIGFHPDPIPLPGRRTPQDKCWGNYLMERSGLRSTLHTSSPALHRHGYPHVSGDHGSSPISNPPMRHREMHVMISCTTLLALGLTLLAIGVVTDDSFHSGFYKSLADQPSTIALLMLLIGLLLLAVGTSALLEAASVAT